jgi:hypothetical protein
LKLWGCRLGDAGIRALARSPHLTGMRRLDLDIGDGPYLVALLEAPWLASLRELRLHAKSISDDDLEALAHCPAVSRLRVLDLGMQQVTRVGTEALANSPYLGGLIRLGIWVESNDPQACAPLIERFGGRFVGCF